MAQHTLAGAQKYSNLIHCIALYLCIKYEILKKTQLLLILKKDIFWSSGCLLQFLNNKISMLQHKALDFLHLDRWGDW